MSDFKIGYCPRCAKNHREKVEKKREEVRKAYGQVSMEVWEKMRLKFDELENKMMERRFHQESNFYGLEDGVITLQYYGRCHECDLIVKFDHTHIIEEI